jgi:hypothetical protein
MCSNSTSDPTDLLETVYSLSGGVVSQTSSAGITLILKENSPFITVINYYIHNRVVLLVSLQVAGWLVGFWLPLEGLDTADPIQALDEFGISKCLNPR